MKTQRAISRRALARRLQNLALGSAAGRPVRVGRASVRPLDRVVVEEAAETADGQTELALEVRWSGGCPCRPAVAPARCKALDVKRSSAITTRGPLERARRSCPSRAG